MYKVAALSDTWLGEDCGSSKVVGMEDATPTWLNEEWPATLLAAIYTV
jgi:hypothetical protein